MRYRSSTANASRCSSNPGDGTKIGASISMNSRASKNARMVRLRIERSRSFLPARRSRSVTSALDALAVLARARVDAQKVAFVDEQRHVDARARLQRRRLLRAARGVALDARLRPGHAHLDEVRHRHAH